jgi:Rrf2 family transcriptional regulator, cysteine metabolism repressor
MKITSKGEYGIRALFDLAQHYEKSPRRSREIAKEQSVPEDYLNQLLIKLRMAGLINSLRGPQGGHVLARSPRQITLYEIVHELEGEISPLAHDVEPNAFDAVLNVVWDEIEQEITAILQATTLYDLCERYAEKQAALQNHAHSMYYI